jgi:glutamine amidotransferase
MNNLVIIDYGSGNLRSVQKAFEWLGYSAAISVNPEDVIGAAGVVFPGQGSSPPAMAALRASGMDQAILEVIQKGKPFFGVCLGLQVLMDWTEEGDTECLHVLTGVTKKLSPDLKVPHMGWNSVQLNFEHPVFEGVPSESSFYFVHSYYAHPENCRVQLGTTYYGREFCSVAAEDNYIATQFHPEKSGSLGLHLYDNFVRRMVYGGAGRRG